MEQIVQVDRAVEIKKLLDEIDIHVGHVVQKAVKVGQLLVEQRAECGGRKFMPWVAANVGLPKRTVYRYIRCYQSYQCHNGTDNLGVVELAQLMSTPSKQEEEEKEQQETDRKKKIKAIAKEKLKLKKEKEDLEREARLEREKEIVELPLDNIEADEDFSIEVEETNEDFEEEVKEAVAELEKDMREEKLLDELPDNRLAKAANQFWENAFKHFYKYDKIRIAKVLIKILHKKYPQLMDEV